MVSAAMFNVIEDVKHKWMNGCKDLHSAAAAVVVVVVIYLGPYWQFYLINSHRDK